MTGSVKQELFKNIMDENGMIDSYLHCKEISVIAFQQDMPVYSPFGNFLNQCLENGIDPSLELIRIEESIPNDEPEQCELKLYSINNNVYKALPPKLPKEVILAIRRIPTKVQQVVLSQNSFVQTIDKLILNYIKNKDSDILEFKLENSYERLLCHAIADYYNLNSYSTGNGKFRVTRVNTSENSGLIPSLSLAELSSKLSFD
ncbi:hypothetical protein EDI_297150 [Entamoeba dispar SAW760]|uniref:R3H domain-containing protein n=1 Tax=Entamoeba dispar (strain ATCC PRA-260 / SAW760) TaxID=370354 RepID=B0EP76_ENTDS|nr:uncharacterized protein EDI_297150 [Entamoeba dispar SAW760]EDR23672.1 hypothetical protein EDI_297150 [Entamoeba dispar SAW760]|eukprot:EDR23672.1 hypothetical protein EDI_297150 [Entamoeba dispar SAW760]